MMNEHEFNFCNENANAIQPTVGKEYLFHIVSEEADEFGKSFFSVRSKELGNQIYRFYFKDSHPMSPGEYIRLAVTEITQTGKVVLNDPALALAEQALNHLPVVDSVCFERENEVLEYKSSIVHTNRGFLDIDKQLGGEIIQAIAGFMNHKGGKVLLGYRNDGTVSGINKDIPYINNSKTDKFVYKPNLDSIELKLRNTVIDRLGQSAVKFVNAEFFRTVDNLLVMHISVKPALRPVFYLDKYLYVRSGNSTYNLSGEAITDFIVERIMKYNEVMNNRVMINTIAAAGIKAEAEEADVEVQENTGSGTRYLTFFKTGEVASLTEESKGNDVIYSLPFTQAEINDEDLRVALCYANGHIAVFTPAAIFNQKLTKDNKRYMNGFNSSADLVNIITCRKDDYIVAESTLFMDGSSYLKAVPISKYNLWQGTSLNAIGYKVVDEKIANTRFKMVKSTDYAHIEDIVCRTGYTAGYPAAGKGRAAAQWLAA